QTIVRSYWQGRGWGEGQSFETRWRQVLNDGVIPNTQSARKSVTPRTGPIPASGASAAANGLEVVFRPDPMIHDGRFANNGWLQELPKPFSRLTWDNAALISPATAKEQGVAT